MREIIRLSLLCLALCLGTAVNAQDRLIALSFDDGPSATTTGRMLDVLRKHGVQASFFVVGDSINDRSAGVMQRAHNEGHDIENHSKTHTAMPLLTPDSMRCEIDYTQAQVQKWIGERPQFFRPPYIALNATMFDTIDLPFICGDHCTDWDATVSVDARVETMLSQARDGLIYLLHDFEGNEKTVVAVDRIIPILKKQGYRFVTVRQLFKEKKVEPQNGRIIYTDVLNIQPWVEGE